MFGAWKATEAGRIDVATFEMNCTDLHQSVQGVQGERVDT